MTSYNEVAKPNSNVSPLINSDSSIIDVVVEVINNYTTDAYSQIENITIAEDMLWADDYFPWLSTSLPWLKTGTSIQIYSQINKP